MAIGIHTRNGGDLRDIPNKTLFNTDVLRQDINGQTIFAYG